MMTQVKTADDPTMTQVQTIHDSRVFTSMTKAMTQAELAPTPQVFPSASKKKTRPLRTCFCCGVGLRAVVVEGESFVHSFLGYVFDAD